ncbi:MAG: nucleotidyl transferase AbiEii/AbiGii toxin family protein [Gammaproteobacteria bacterium]|nr:nucleotidyl transferase AbiEii/AbiGii toxin family protein [Gammaproteobacteria bacterium]MBU1644873.1 nucleotidyl transferase AbiEii/AbiGii toxin family protein [Gammaproteobacteria bacterium]MBU1971332.1 nucleotidyl transferase AbiEii/AbiGii toxin family protein [Gammaproteobacteria bacterium]
MLCVWPSGTSNVALEPFKRLHHQFIAQVLHALDGPMLREAHCLFGGGTAIALRNGEYRESVDIDFLVSDIQSYRGLRHKLTGPTGIESIMRDAAAPLTQLRDIRSDQYGIRTLLRVADQTIKFEIVLEGRIELEKPGAGDEVCGIATLTPLDLLTSKLLANSDRWNDDGVFNRDVIDLAMMTPGLPMLRKAVAKAEQAYGESICQDLDRAIDRLQTRHDWMDRCMQAMAMDIPKAVLWKRVRALRRVLPDG